MNGRKLHLPVIFLSVLAMALGSTAYAGGQVVTNGLVSWWKFDETAGAAAADSWSTNTGTLNGGATWTNTGYISNGLAFNGVDSYVSMGHQPSLMIPKLTVEAWVNISNTHAAVYDLQGVIDGSGSDSWGGYVLYYNESADRWKAQVYCGNPDTIDWGALVTIASDAGATTGVWTHLVLTCDGTTAKMYINGALQSDTKSIGDLTYATVGSDVEIGRYYFNPDCFNGLIDEVRIYNRALSAEEVLNNYVLVPFHCEYQANFDAGRQGWSGPAGWVWDGGAGYPAVGSLATIQHGTTDVLTTGSTIDAGGKRTVEAGFYTADPWGCGAEFEGKLTLKFTDQTEVVRTIPRFHPGGYCIANGWNPRPAKAVFHEAKDILQIKDMQIVCYAEEVSGPPYYFAVDSFFVNARDWPILEVAAPGAFSPNGDGIYDTQTINVYPTNTMTIMLDILDANNSLVANLAANQIITQLTNYFWNGKDGNGVLQPNGDYMVRLTAPGVNAFMPIAVNVISNWPRGYSSKVQYFPIGIYNLGPATGEDPSTYWNATLTTLTNAGFNTMHVCCAPDLRPTLLNCASNHGVKVILQSHPGFYGLICAGFDGINYAPVSEAEAYDTALWEKNGWGGYGALLGWDIHEEAELGMVDNWVLCNRVKAGMDSNHPNISVQAPSSEIFTALTGKTDLAVGYFDIYPMGAGVPTNANLTYYTAFLDSAIAAIGTNTPIWPMLQAFGSAYWRLPTEVELRGMTYLALASGARGIFYYQEGILNGGNSAPLWAPVTNLTRELKILAPTLMALAKTGMVTQADYRIGCFQFTDNPARKAMIVASKRPDANVTASITVSGDNVWRDALSGAILTPSDSTLSVPLAEGAGRVLVQNTAPTVSVSSPNNGAAFNAPASIDIAANANDSDGAIARMEFYNGGVLLGADNSNAGGWTWSWTNVAAGGPNGINLTARAYDNDNASATSVVVSCTVTDAVLKCYWKFDETGGTVATNSSGNYNHGMLNKNPVRTAGRINNGLSFTGVNTQYVYKTGATGLPKANSNQTECFWFYVASHPTTRKTALSVSGSSSGIFMGYSSSNVFGAWKYDGSLLVSTTPPSAGTWHHAAYVRNGATNALYIDGIIKTTSITSPNTSLATTINAARSPMWPYYYWPGMLDEIRVYSRALSAAEIAAMAEGKQ